MWDDSQLDLCTFYSHKTGAHHTQQLVVLKISLFCSKQDNLAVTWDFQQCGMCEQQRLRPACAYAQSVQILCLSFEYSMNLKLLTEKHLDFLSLIGSCTGSSEYALVKMPHWWKSHVTAQLYFLAWLEKPWMVSYTFARQVRPITSERQWTSNKNNAKWMNEWINNNNNNIVCQNWPETYKYSMTFYAVFVNLRKKCALHCCTNTNVNEINHNFPIA